MRVLAVMPAVRLPPGARIEAENGWLGWWMEDDGGSFTPRLLVYAQMVARVVRLRKNNGSSVST